MGVVVTHLADADKATEEGIRKAALAHNIGFGATVLAMVAQGKLLMSD